MVVSWVPHDVGRLDGALFAVFLSLLLAAISTYNMDLWMLGLGCGEPSGMQAVRVWMPLTLLTGLCPNSMGLAR